MKFYQQFLSYAVAIASTAIALLLTFSVEPFMPRTIGAFFYIAVIVTAWHGGWRSGSVAVVLSLLAINYWFIPPRYQFWTEQLEDVVQLIIFLLVAVLINLLTSNFRDSKQKIERLGQQLAQENAEQLRMALSAAQMGMWDWNLVTGEINWSPEHEQLFGLTPGTFDGRYETLDARLHLDDRETLKQAVERSLRERVPYKHEYRVVWTDGSIHWIEGRGQAFYDKAGQPVRMMGTVMAINERKQAEAALRENQILLQRQLAEIETIYHSAPIGLSVLDTKLRFIRINQRLAEINGLSVEAHLGCTVREVVPNLADAAEQLLRSILETGEPVLNVEIIGETPAQPGVQRTWLESWLPLKDGDRIIGINIVCEEITQRIQSEQALRQSEERFRRAILDFPMPIILHAEDGEVVQINQTWTELSGYTHAEIPTIADWIEKAYGEQRERVRADIDHLYRLNERVSEGEYSITTRNGENRIWEFCSAPLGKLPDGRRLVITTALDVSDRKAVEAALVSSERRLRTIIETEPECVKVLTADGALLNMNPAGLAMIEADNLEQVLGQSMCPMVAPANRQAFVNLTRQVAQGHSGLLEFEILGLKGTCRWLESHAVPLQDESGAITEILAVTRDITERKQAQAALIRAKEELEIRVQERTAELSRANAQLQQELIERQRVEEALRQSEEKFRQLAENIEDVFWMSDVKHQQLIYVSPAYESVWGSPREDVYRDLSQFYKAIHPEDFQRVDTAFFEKVSQGLFDEEYRIIRSDGSIRWIRDRAFPVKSESGELIRVAGIAQDISDRKLAESALQQAKRAAEAANQAKSIFLANMSHELRTPLNAILGFSQLMNCDTNLNSEQQENLSIITRSGEHLLTLINQVLDLAKIEAGRTTLNETAFDLMRLLDDLEDMFQFKAQEKGLLLICDRYDDVPQYVRADEIKLRQVLMNLLSNAIKFTKEGGISLRVASHKFNGISPASSQAEQPTSERGQLTLYFEIEDTGPGIAPDELDQLFQAFQQTQAGFESQQGTGLGLIISQQFVKLMGGEITVSSTVGRATIFKFNIQLGVADATAIKTKPPTRRVIALQPNQPSYRLLIVDDRSDNRQLLIKLLNPLGFEINEATNGVEAIEVWSNWEPHLIFMDMRMPVMDGYEATKRIKATTQGHATAIVALSASNFRGRQAPQKADTKRVGQVLPPRQIPSLMTM